MFLRYRLIFLMTGLALTSPFGMQAFSNELIVEVSAGRYDRQDIPVAVELPPEFRDQKGFTATRLDNDRPSAVQVDRSGPVRAVWMLGERLAAGETRRYRLVASAAPRQVEGVAVADDGKRLSVAIAGKLVLVYNQATVPSPDPKEPYYAKSGYIHPVYNPSGQVVTDDFNPDHAHQHGIMFAWRKTTFEGRETNGWDQKAGTGRVEHAATEGFGGGPVFGWFDVRLRQVDLTAPGGPEPVLDERWRVRVYHLRDRHLFDLEAVQTCAGDAPVTIDEMHYGGLMVRGHAHWQETKEFDFLTGEGKTKVDGNQTRPRWCDLFGRLDAQSTGVLVLDHPGNYRFPQPVRLHPTMPYFCFTPASLGSFAIEPGKPYVSRYRFSVHDGKLAAADAQRIFDDYAEPPAVRITAAK